VSESANVAVQVSGDDLTGVLIPTAPGALVSGRIEWDGEAPRTGGPAGAPLRVEAIAADGRPQMLGSVGMTDDADARGFVGPDGRFRIEGLLGTVRFAVTGVPPRWMLRAVMVDGADITGTGTDVARNASSAPVLTAVGFLTTHTDALSETGLVSRDGKQAAVLTGRNDAVATSDLASDDAMLGLSGFTSIVRVRGITTRSMSSIGMTPTSTWSPITSAPTNPTRFLKRTSIGPT
jgi:hypothetical protein